MHCKGCGKEIAADEARMVAEWPFCQECFEGLMSEADARSSKKQASPGAEETAAPAAEPAIEPAPPEAPAVVHPRSCQLCGCQLPDDCEQVLGVWWLCETCKADLTPARPEAPAEAEPEPEPVPDDRPHDLLGRPIARSQSEVSCAGCGRTILAVAAKFQGGNLYCPDCAQKLAANETSGEEAPALNVAAAPPTDSPSPAAHPSPAIGLRVSVAAKPGGSAVCEACGGPGEGGKQTETDGFHICAACLNTDRELALRLARERHRRMMLRRMETDDG